MASRTRRQCAKLVVAPNCALRSANTPPPSLQTGWCRLMWPKATLLPLQACVCRIAAAPTTPPNAEAYAGVRFSKMKTSHMPRRLSSVEVTLDAKMGANQCITPFYVLHRVPVGPRVQEIVVITAARPRPMRQHGPKKTQNRLPSKPASGRRRCWSAGIGHYWSHHVPYAELRAMHPASQTAWFSRM